MGKFISVTEAANLVGDGVTTETIRNLRKAKVLRYKKRGNLYLVDEEQVLEYKERIQEIHEAERNIDEYKTSIERERDALFAEQESFRAWWQDAKMSRYRIEVLIRTLSSVLSHYDTEHVGSLSEREIDTMRRFLTGESLADVAERMCLTRERARQIWCKALHKFAHVQNEIQQRDKMIETLKSCLQEERYKVYAYEHPELADAVRDSAYKPAELETTKILMRPIQDFDLTVRCLNVLKTAEIGSLYELLKYIHRMDLLKFRNFGKKSLSEIDELLEHYGLSWGMSLEPYEPIIRDIVAGIIKV